MLQNIQKLTSGFETITLAEMDNVKLLDRMDSKFYFKIEKLENLLTEMLPFYKLLQVNGVILQRYESPYYDTENFNLYKKHQSGKQNRYKIRFRNYLDSNLIYFEIKFKNNKSRTIKYRLRSTNMEMDEATEVFLLKNCPLSKNMLQNKLTVNYSRLTFVGIAKCERVTIDFLLSFKNDSTQVDFYSLVIAELKQDKASLSSPFAKLMCQQKINEGGISKYCLGIAAIYKQVKTNLFKEKLNQIKKLIS